MSSSLSKVATINTFVVKLGFLLDTKSGGADCRYANYNMISLTLLKLQFVVNNVNFLTLAV